MKGRANMSYAISMIYEALVIRGRYTEKALKEKYNRSSKPH